MVTSRHLCHGLGTVKQGVEVGYINCSAGKCLPKLHRFEEGVGAMLCHAFHLEDCFEGERNDAYAMPSSTFCVDTFEA